jgi:hypothetical protein
VTWTAESIHDPDGNDGPRTPCNRAFMAAVRRPRAPPMSSHDCYPCPRSEQRGRVGWGVPSAICPTFSCKARLLRARRFPEFASARIRWRTPAPQGRRISLDPFLVMGISPKLPGCLPIATNLRSFRGAVRTMLRTLSVRDRPESLPDDGGPRCGSGPARVRLDRPMVGVSVPPSFGDGWPSASWPRRSSLKTPLIGPQALHPPGR